METTIEKTDKYKTFVEKRPQIRDYARYKKGPSETFHLIIQFLCHQQLLEVKRQAEKKKVFLKGDIPILISPDSADVWAHPEFFDKTFVAGSPPTTFDPVGQIWKFPLYNWQAMEQNHFDWWHQRIRSAAEYFHLYRIDHILGFL